MPECCTITTADGVALEGEIARAERSPARAAIVLCHPHPQHGGTMRSIVIGALFEALPRADVTCLRFNFRGVEGSSGAYDDGRGELLDVRGALGALTTEIEPGVPTILAGWSFGADMVLSTDDDRLAAWLAIAPPLRFAADFGAVARDARPKLLLLAQHDEFRDPAEVVEDTESWNQTDVEIVAGASHFFVGRTDRVVDLTLDYVERVLAVTSP